MNPGKQSLIVEGNILIDDDDDESSDDESEDMQRDSTQISRDTQYHVSKDEDEEELEVFTGGTQIASISNSVPAVKKSTPLSLIDAMAASVGTVESTDDSTGFGEIPLDLSTPNKVKPKPVVAAKTALAPKEEETDVFGIAYKPYGKKKKDYDTPQGPSFEDEHEFERELQSSSFLNLNTVPGSGSGSGSSKREQQHQVVVEEEEEEDEFSDVLHTPKKDQSSTSTSTSNDAHASAVLLAVQRAANRLKEEEARILSNITTIDPVSTSLSPDTDTDIAREKEREKEEEREREQESGLAFLATSKSKLQEIQSIYSCGLGDNEVYQLDKNNNKRSTTLVVEREKQQLQEDDNDSGTDRIEEGDEEEEERREEREEREKLQQLKKRQEEILQLEEQWKQLEAGTTTPPPSSSSESTNTSIPSSNDPSPSPSLPLSLSLSSSSAAVPPMKGVRPDPSRISYQSAETYFREVDLSMYRSQIVMDDRDGSGSGSGSGKWRLFGGPGKLKFEGWEEEKMFPFLIAQVEYDPSIPTHLHILQTIFKSLVGSGRTCPITGPHWEQIGFQGNDPCTDINRSMRMLAALQMLHLTTQHGSLARKLHALSNITPDPGRGKAGASLDLSWPMFCVSIMFTKETIQVFRTGQLNKLCNSKGQVLSVLHEFYRALFIEFARLVSSSKTIHHAEHLAILRKQCATDPLAILKAAEKVQLETIITPTAKFDDIEGLTDKMDEEGVSVTGLALPSRASKFFA